ncbi:MAG: hypothetical protein KDE31_24510, partial [Caldilineaceae bacterium]|nr:hypothetical protein [Caldilineaceae bacterium]
ESAETQSDPHWSARLADQVRTWIAQLVPMSGMTPAFAVRGNENQTDAHYSCETASFTIYLETTLDPNDPLAADHTGIGTISGMLVGMIPEGTQVHLWRDGHLVDSAHLDPGGDFRFTALPVGHYAVMINAPMEKIYIPEIALGE